MKAFPFFLVALLALAGCQGMERMRQQVGLETAKPPPDPKSQMGALEKRIALLVTEARRKIDPKAKPLAPDAELARVARARATDMAAKNYLAHAAPNGDTSASLLMEEDKSFQGLLGENLAAQHYRKETGVAVDAYAQRFLDEWLKSPPHRENLAFANYDRAGVGAAVNGDTVYVAVLFATDLGLPPHKGDNSVTALDSPADARPPSSPPAPVRLRGALGTPEREQAPALTPR
jgi:uncharacterized protein YkwD